MGRAPITHAGYYSMSTFQSYSETSGALCGVKGAVREATYLAHSLGVIPLTHERKIVGSMLAESATSSESTVSTCSVMLLFWEGYCERLSLWGAGGGAFFAPVSIPLTTSSPSVNT